MSSAQAHGPSVRRMSLLDWAALPEDEPGEWVDGYLVEEEAPEYVHELVITWLSGAPRLGHAARARMRRLLRYAVRSASSAPGRQAVMSERSTRKRKARRAADEPSAASLAEIPELDFTKLRRVPNPFKGARFTNVRVIDPALASAFPDSETVNRALRRVLAGRKAAKRRARAA